MSQSLPFLTPETVGHVFVVQTSAGSVDTRGRATLAWTTGGSVSGILADLTPQEQLRYQQLQHPITHTLAVQGRPTVKPRDRLLYGGRVFYVHLVEEPGLLGLWTLLRLEERSDATA